MKKPLSVILFLIFLIISFVGGARFNQYGVSQITIGTGEREILHYVDPMNPVNISKEPGIAPCGMPMEPVYAEEEADGVSSAGLPSGTVRINTYKQQLIGVQVDQVTKTNETSLLRALGRIEPDENRVYSMVAATDGWMGEIHESTTGSLVTRDQLMGKIRIYDYDFFTWQQRYLTELGNAGRRRVYLSPLSGAAGQLDDVVASRQKAGLLLPDVGAPIALASNALPEETPADSPLTKNKTREKSARKLFTGEDDILYASKARQELLDLGVAQSQLDQLAESGVYVTYIEMRSPVDGLVLSRNVTARQKINRGAECFRVADLSRVWIETDIYDIEAKLIQPGTSARVTIPRLNEQYTARVTEVLPRYDASSRTLKVRLEMENPEYVFRPDMFVDVEFLVEIESSITVPSSAVIDSGKSKTVYVVTGEDIFEPRAVLTGWRLNDRVEIIKGLEPGDRIVVSGNFLIDSESRMKLAAARLMKDNVEKTTEEPSMVIPEGTKSPILIKNIIKNAAIEKKVTDPICGMVIDAVRAGEAGLSAEAKGITYYFCTLECLDEFHRHGPQIEESANVDRTSAASSHHREKDLRQMSMSSGDSSHLQNQGLKKAPPHHLEQQMQIDSPDYQKRAQP